MENDVTRVKTYFSIHTKLPIRTTTFMSQNTRIVWKASVCQSTWLIRGVHSFSVAAVIVIIIVALVVGSKIDFPTPWRCVAVVWNISC